MIETVLERIAVALETIAGSPRKDLNIDGPEIFDTPQRGAVFVDKSDPIPPTRHTGTFIAPPVEDEDDDAPGDNDGEGPDSAGHYWDARIHSTAKTKVKKTGEWKLMRGVDKDLAAKVLAEQAAAPTAAPDGIAPPPTTAPDGIAPPPTTAPDGGITMKDFVTKALGAGYTSESMAPFLAVHGITALPMLNKQPELMATILAEMGVM